MAPSDLSSEMKEKAGYGLVVFPKGQLPLRPGLSEEELGNIFSAYART